MKRILLFFILIFVGLISTGKIAHASSDLPVSIKVNDKIIKTDVDPYIENGTLYAPIRFISEALNSDQVIWRGETNTAIIVKDGKRIELTIGSTKAVVNGKAYWLNGKVSSKYGRTFVPVRFVSEMFNCDVKWNGSTYTAEINKSGITVPTSLIYNRGYQDDEIIWLARIVEAESKGEPYAGKLGVANVILNRRDSKSYPNSIYGVIFDKKYGVQFEPTMNGTIYNTPSSQSVIAAKNALEGSNNIGSCLYFLNPVIARSSWIVKNRPYYTTINNHDFYI